MSLVEYKRKRHFRRTPEPPAKKPAKRGWSFCIQKHAASHLHYDFRLELDGVLKSWAVPKGPSLDPATKRLAMQVEDHPVEYGGFEGIIPQGEYGGGTVMLWDRGTWTPTEDPEESYRKGKLKFQLHGEKLRGGWFLVRRAGSSRSTSSDQRTWFLIKERDEFAAPETAGKVTDDLPLSVKSGRDLDEIAASRDRTWSSSRKSNGRTKAAAVKKPRAARRRKGRGKAPSLKGLSGARSAELPKTIEVQLATLTKEAPQGEQWLHEIKLDGYRMICRIEKGKVRFISRNDQDWTSHFSSLAEAAGELPVKQALLDGEVVALKPDGTTDFQLLQNAFRGNGAQNLKYYAFDLLYLDGKSLTGVPLEERKRVLQELLTSVDAEGALRYSDHLAGNGPEFFQQACKMGLEGIVSKRRDQPHVGGRSYDWLKIKCLQTSEFVIGGYTDPSGSRTGFGSLLLGYHNGHENLTYAGKVGTGFNQQTLAQLWGRLKELRQPKSPFSTGHGSPRSAHWVKPELVAQIAFSNWTQDGILRQPSFQGLREDKPADDVVREKPVPVVKAVKESEKPSRNGRARKAMSSKTKTPRKAARDKDVADELAGVRLTSPDKVMYREQGITKLDLARYYYQVADWMLPHVAGRPLVLVRCPEGRDSDCFYQKHPTVGTPKNLRQIPVREKSGTKNYLVADDVAGLISLVQIGALEIHAWGSKADDIEKPDRLVFDLDPDPSVPWSRVIESARQIRQFLQDLGLESFVKTTGGKGLHLVVPIQRRHDWDEAKEFCKDVADAVVAADPHRYTSNMSKSARGGKIFIDYLRNGRGATAVVAYSTRAREGAPVSTPLSWDELSASIGPDHYHVGNLPGRLARLKRDPWDGIDGLRQSLSASVKKKLKGL